MNTLNILYFINNSSYWLFLCSSFTESLGSNLFTVQVNEAASGVRTRTAIQVLDRHDGSYLVRYKLMQGYHDVVINVFYNGQHVADSPYTLSGILNYLCHSCRKTCLLIYIVPMYFIWACDNYNS